MFASNISRIAKVVAYVTAVFGVWVANLFALLI
jgi:hypothetical protein